MTHESTAAGNTTQAVPATAGEAAASDAAGRVCRTAPLLLIALPLVILGYGLDAGSRARFLIRDRDGKFSGLFDTVLTDAGIETCSAESRCGG